MTMGKRLLWLVGVLMVVSAACSTAEPVIVVYEASSSLGEPLEVMYRTPDGVVTETVDSPWVFEIEMQGSYSVQVVARNLGDDGDVACRITGAEIGDGEITTGGQADAQCSGSVTRSGGTIESSYTTDFTLRDEPEAAPIPEPAPTATPEETAPVDNQPGVQLATLPTIELPGTAPFRPTRRGNFILLGGTNTVSVIDLVNDEVSSLEPAGLNGAWLPTFGDDGLIYVASCESGEIQRFGRLDTEVEVMTTLEGCPTLTLTLNNVLWVMLNGTKEVVRFDLANGTELSRVAVRTEVSDMVDFAGVVYLALDDQPFVGRLDLATGAPMEEIEFQGQAEWFVADQGLLFLRARNPAQMGLVLNGEILANTEYQSVALGPGGSVYAQTVDGIGRLTDDLADFEAFVEIESGPFLVAAGSSQLYLMDGATLYEVDLGLFD